MFISPIRDMFPRVKSVTVTIEMEDGRVESLVSRPNSLIQNKGVSINEVSEVLNDELGPTPRGNMIDMRKTTTVTWVEQWTDMVK